jgi:para-aminobenzoate synthetase
VRIVLIDNHDSYTWNLAHLIARVAPAPPWVVANDAVTLADLRAWAPDAIVLSPGPGRPGVGRDLGIGAELLEVWRGPLLGVCLGHQAIVWAAGGRVDRAPRPVHGRIDGLKHDGEGLFAGLPQDLPVVRYHSLAAVEPLPDALRVTARSPDGVVQALAHRALPWFGVQFHPESVGTPHGAAMLAAFVDAARSWTGPRWSARVRPASSPAPAARPSPTPAAAPVRVVARRLARPLDAERVFVTRIAGRPGSFWLDSSGRQGAGASRFSYLGAADGPLGRELRATVGRGASIVHADGTITAAPADPLDALRPPPLAAPLPDLPFPFRGGWVGWIGHELSRPAAAVPPDLPDVAFAFCDRLIVADHDRDETWLVAVLAPTDDADAALDALAATAGPGPAAPEPAPSGTDLAPEVEREAYLDAVRRAQEAILDGESYEICLTQRLRGPALDDPLSAYRRLRRQNPAPYGAFVTMGGATVLSSSPELFVAVDRDGAASARPIKGTAARRASPADDEAARRALAASEKDRSENLMIVDLLRHDLGAVCAWGTVDVPSLMAVESFATVHQLVSTITGTLAAGRDAVDLVKAAFPPGSMTGAPKERTLELIDALETSRRGPYGGALGWFSVDGAAALSVVIRAAVQVGDRVEVGVGGAIVALSDPASEWDEAQLKGRALRQALGR